MNLAEILQARVDRLLDLIAEDGGDATRIELTRPDFEALFGGLVVDAAASATYRATVAQVGERSLVFAQMPRRGLCAFRLPGEAPPR